MQGLRNHAYNLVEEMRGAYFYLSMGDILRELKIVRRPLEALIGLTEEFMERYSQRKIRENLMDYDDMEHFALRLLIDHWDENDNPVPSQIALEKSMDFEEIYIDEYQDSNFIQDAILRSVSREAEDGHNMFMVGDVKQSIYSFRLARPELFLEKYHRYQGPEKEYQLIELRNNFRSRREVLQFTNDIFIRSCTSLWGILSIQRSSAGSDYGIPGKQRYDRRNSADRSGRGQSVGRKRAGTGGPDDCRKNKGNGRWRGSSDGDGRR